MFWLLLEVALGQVLNEFRFCSQDTSQDVIDLDRACGEDKSSVTYDPGFFDSDKASALWLHIMSKMHNHVNGFGWSCEKLKL